MAHCRQKIALSVICSLCINKSRFKLGSGFSHIDRHFITHDGIGYKQTAGKQ
jgi:hypothetical protein